MAITIEQLRALDAGSYRFLDIRSEGERAYGEIPGSISVRPDTAEYPTDSRPTYIVVGRKNAGTEAFAEQLRQAGLRADVLTGGYQAWLLDLMKHEDTERFTEKVELSLRKKFRKTIWTNFTRALKLYRLVNPGDKVAVCISGGKDSMLMAMLFRELRRYSEVPFEVEYLVMDPGYSPENRQIIEENARRLNIPIRIFETDIFNSVYNVKSSPCYLCARMRRGWLYTYAKELGCNKIALGHHYDDVIETILMGMLYGAQIQTMMPKLHSTNYPGMELIRPMYLIREDEIKKWRDYNGLHFLQCACRFTESCAADGNDHSRSKRAEIKELIRELKKTNPDVEARIFRSVENVCLDAVIGYKTGGVEHHFLETYDGPEPHPETAGEGDF